MEIVLNFFARNESEIKSWEKLKVRSLKRIMSVSKEKTLLLGNLNVTQSKKKWLRPFSIYTTARYFSDILCQESTSHSKVRHVWKRQKEMCKRGWRTWSITQALIVISHNRFETMLSFNAERWGVNNFFCHCICMLYGVFAYLLDICKYFAK